MALLILSKQVIQPEETVASVAVVAFKKGFKLVLDGWHNIENRHNTDIYISRANDNQEYFYLGIESVDDIIESYDLLNLKFEDASFYRLAVTDQAEFDHLIYDFALEYLRLNPDHCISLYGETFFFLEDMEKLESKGGYYKDWCYKKPEN
ncbi:hypothetical protein QWY31_00140 [Cytophagales bacterium LB-30]|uniref:Uncharacterized protein n=1 Tax=Shiella aurantiaca TaxID=3058365 RepID=A0ABT8F0H5_9BACT|nr:hypothetical protein [Shiella aurantiaca]MDN4163883.1 hypothetical protein [Shiella aurantiaca]